MGAKTDLNDDISSKDGAYVMLDTIKRIASTRETSIQQITKSILNAVDRIRFNHSNDFPIGADLDLIKSLAISLNDLTVELNTTAINLVESHLNPEDKEKSSNKKTKK